MGRSKTPEATAVKLRANHGPRRHSEETKDKISAANKGRRLTVQERVRRSLVAIEQGRGEKLNRRLADDPVLAARTRQKRQEGAAKATEHNRRERARRANAPVLAGVSKESLQAYAYHWDATRDLTKLQPPRFK